MSRHRAPKLKHQGLVAGDLSSLLQHGVFDGSCFPCTSTAPAPVQKALSLAPALIGLLLH